MDVVKIDRSFVSTLGRDPASDASVAAIVDLVHTLDMSVVAEGIETPDQYRHIAALGCEACQGFYFARPQPVTAIDSLMDRHHDPDAIRLPLPP